jgi:anthraniloyl-CoA monooxygenase
MFTPFRRRELTLPTRVVLAPMDMYGARDGTLNDFHLVHPGARALGGAALVMTPRAARSAPRGASCPASGTRRCRWWSLAR